MKTKFEVMNRQIEARNTDSKQEQAKRNHESGFEVVKRQIQLMTRNSRSWIDRPWSFLAVLRWMRICTISPLS